MNCIRCGSGLGYNSISTGLCSTCQQQPVTLTSPPPAPSPGDSSGTSPAQVPPGTILADFGVVHFPAPSPGEREDDPDIVRVVPPFQHPGYVIRRAKPRPFVDDSEPCPTCAEQSAQIAALRQERATLAAQVRGLTPLVTEVLTQHADPTCSEYNECDTAPCQWCSEARAALASSVPADRAEERT